MDLEDLVSRTITFDNGERIILCFSKRCRPQIAWNGHLYVAATDVSFNNFAYRTCEELLAIQGWLCISHHLLLSRNELCA